MYEFTELFVYKFVFIAELLVATHLCFCRKKKKSLYPLRIALGAIISFALGYAYPIASYSAAYSSVMFFVLFALVAASFYFIYEVNVKELFFLSVAAYTMQHFAHEIYAIIANTFKIVSSATMGMYGNKTVSFSLSNRLFWINVLVYLWVYLGSYWLLYKLFCKKVNSEDILIKNFHIVVITALILAVDIVLNAVAVYIPNNGYDKAYSYLTSVYNLICCMLILYMQLGMCVQQGLRRELETMSVLFSESEKRFKQSEENATLLNLKCHDLKYRIRECADKIAIDKEYVDEIVDIVDIYDSTAKTGNAVLDLILQEKSLYCSRHKIVLTCLADCSRLNFIKDSDLYSLFGNVIDNAIEAVVKVEDERKKNVNIIVKNVDSFISIRVDNYFTGNISFNKEGLPKTQKEDNGYHGFGIKSVKMITEKYGGDLSVSVDGESFSLSILFPFKSGGVKENK